MSIMKNVARFVSGVVAKVLVSLIVFAAPVATHATAFKFDTGGGDGSLYDTYPNFTIVGNSWGKHSDGETIGINTTYSTTFSRHGTLVFDWVYVSYDENNGDWEDLLFDPAGYTLNGGYVWLPYNVHDDAGEFVEVVTSGSVSLDIKPGDKFSWWVFSTDDCCGPATLQVSAQYFVPEPGTLALVGLSLAGLAFVRRRV